MFAALVMPIQFQNRAFSNSASTKSCSSSHNRCPNSSDSSSSSAMILFSARQQPKQQKEAEVVSPSNRLSSLPTYVFALLDEMKEKAHAKGSPLIDLGMGNPDRPVPEAIIDQIKAAAEKPENHRYPSFKGKEMFAQAVSDWMKRRYHVQINPKTEVLPLSGSKEGIYQLTMAYVGKNDICLVPDIHYPVHGRAPILAGGKIHFLPMKSENNFLPDLDAIPKQIARRAKILFLNYPNNPTGAIATSEFYKKAVEFCKKNNIILVSDLAYGEIAYDGHKPLSIFETPGAKDVAIEFHSFSKSFNMAGFRLGFAVGNPQIIKTLHDYRTNVGYGTPSFIQEGGAFALNHAERLLPDIVKTYKKRRDIVVNGFRSLGWKIEEPLATLYVWLPTPKGFSSMTWIRHLMDKAGVVVTPGNAFGPGGEGFFRVSLVSPEKVLKQALDRLKEKNIHFTSS